MSEFSKSNFQRIYFINLLLGIPLIVLFAWPYYYAAKLIGLMEALRYLGAFLFSLPFMMTILHGHVTMALGSVHRDHYYQWLTGNHYTYGLLFWEFMTSTRFRLILLVVSLLFLPVGYLLSFWKFKTIFNSRTQPHLKWRSYIILVEVQAVEYLTNSWVSQTYLSILCFILKIILQLYQTN